MSNINENKIEEPNPSDIAELLVLEVASDEFGDSYDAPTEESADTESELYEHKVEKWAEDDEVLKQDLESEEAEDLQMQLENALWRKSVGIKDGASDELENKESIATEQEDQKWIDQAVDVTGKPFGPDVNF